MSSPISTPDQPSNGSSDQPSTEDVLRLLDSEVREIQTAEARNGWNLWVVLAATVGLIWLLTGEIKSNTTSWLAVSKLVIAEALVIDGLRWLYNLLGYPGRSKEVRFYGGREAFGANRAQLVFEMLRSGAYIFLVWFVPTFPWYAGAAVSAFYLLVFVLLLVGFVLSFSAYVIPTERNKVSHGFLAGLLISWIAAIVSSVSIVPSGALTITDIRVSFLLIGITYLLILFGHTLRVSTTAESLSELRRKLVAGLIGPSAAVHEAEIILGGMQTIDALREDVLWILSLLDGMDAQTRSAFKAQKAIESNFPAAGDDAATLDAKLNTITSLRAGYESFLNERQRLYSDFLERIAAFHKRARQVRVSSAANPTLIEIDNLFQQKTKTVDENFNKLVEESAELDRRWVKDVAVYLPQSVERSPNKA